MHCEHVTNKTTTSESISATNSDDFKKQFIALLESSQEPVGIVYVWRTQASIQRLRGKSPIVYIGKANGSLYSRYRSYVSHETKEYWERYSHIIATYGEISIDIYTTTNPEVTENNFLYQYRQDFMELPPINLRSFRTSLLEQQTQ